MKKQLLALSILFISTSLGAMETNTIDQQAREIDLELIKAVQKNDLNACKELINKGANLEARDEFDETPVMWAIDKGYIELVSFFIKEKKADIHIRDKEGLTLLHYAIMCGHFDIVSLLIENGGDIYATDNDRFTPIDFIEDESIKNRLIKESAAYQANLTKEEEDTPPPKLSLSAMESKKLAQQATGNDLKLIEAATEGNLDKCRELINNGANLEARDQYCMTPLSCAIDENKIDLVSFLIKKGANIHALDDRNSTPLHIATLLGLFKIGSLLINKGANIHAKDNSGSTPLHYAIMCGHFDLVSLLISKGADIYAKDNNDITPTDLIEDIKISDLPENMRNKLIKESANYQANLTKEEDTPPPKLSEGSNAPYIIVLVGSVLGLYLVNELILKKQKKNELSLTQTSEQNLNVESQKQ